MKKIRWILLLMALIVVFVLGCAFGKWLCDKEKQIEAYRIYEWSQSQEQK